MSQIHIISRSTYLIFFFSLLIACSKTNDEKDLDNGNNSVLSNAKAIVNFELLGNPTSCEREVLNAINDQDGIIEIVVTHSTNLQSIDPLIEISEGATISPNGPQDFNTNVTYTVTAEDGSVASYVVITSKGPTEREILEKIYEMNPGNTTGWDLNDSDIGNWNGVYTNADGAVERLVLQVNGIVNFPVELSQLCLLDEFVVNGNALDVIPDPVFELQSITKLGLVNVGLTGVPDGIGKLINLESLNLVVNQISTLSGEIGNLKNLSYIQISENHLEAIPKEIGQLSKLRILYLGLNKITEIPAEIGQLQNLEILTLSGNNITVLPTTLGQLGKLQDLNLDDNQITALPSEISSITSLQDLLLARNLISELPEGIGNLSSLITLDLTANSLISIPTEIGNLVELRYLLINGNNLNLLPVEISQLNKLSYLNIYANQLTSIPQAICDMVEDYGTQILKENEVACN